MTVKLLIANALFQITFSSLVGSWLLYRMHVRGNRGGAKDLVAAHVDWVMLALVEVAVAAGIVLFEVRGALAPACLIIIGGWLNPVPYLARGFGTNAFVMAGGRLQRGLAAVGAASVVALTSGLIWITVAVLAS